MKINHGRGLWGKLLRWFNHHHLHDIPDVNKGMIDKATSLGMQIACIICNDPDAQVDDVTSVTFPAIVQFLPRAGDQITLEDDAVCEVVRSSFKVTRFDEYGGLLPTVYARRISAK